MKQLVWIRKNPQSQTGALPSLRVVLFSVVFFVLTGCKVGGKVTSAQTTPTPVALISAPIVSTPAVSPYYSKANALLISGVCENGAVVTVTGATDAVQTCASNSFSFIYPQTNDGIYTFLISQGAPSQSASNQTALVWIRKSSVAQPIVTSPATSPFSSGQPTLAISGSCETGAVISLSGDAGGSTVCGNSTFSISVPKAADGSYNIQITQTDGAGNTASTSIVWQKQALGISPNNPYLVVQTPQVFTITGGSGVYTAVLEVNNSGASFDSATKTYTPGSLANKVDTLKVTDSLGNTGTVYITTVAGASDHFVLPAASGADQTALPGQLLTNPLKVQLVDRYGNGIPAIPLLFQVMAGDSVLTSQAIQVSDAQGYAQATLKLGFNSVTTKVYVRPLSGALPDLAASGNATLVINEFADSPATGKVGSTFTVGLNPSAMAYGDFNADGKTDIAILNVGDPSLGILLGKGNGLFQTMTKVQPLCGGPNALVAADFNSDGKTDIVVACSGSNKVAMVLGNGAGGFSHATGSPFSTGANETIPTSVAVADFDLDNKLDLAISSAGGAVVGIWRGNGNGTFITPTAGEEFAIGQSPSSIVALDLNKDTYPDLAIANSADDSISVLMNAGNGSFLGQITYGTSSNPSALAVGDFNSDTYPDLAVVENGAGQVSVFLNQLTGILQMESANPVGTSPTWLSIGDFDGDTKLDVAITNSGDNSAGILSGFGNGTFTYSPAIPTVTNPVFLLTPDLDNDGYLDLVVSGNTDQVVQVIPGRAGANFGLTTTVGAGPLGSAGADFDSDGKMDLAVVNSGGNSISILKGIGYGFFNALTTLPTANNPTSVKLGDFNRDGFQDLVVANRGSGTIRIYLCNGDGTFQTFVSYGVGSSPSDVAIQDLNADGYLDLFVANTASSTVSVLRGNGDGTFAAKVDYPTDSGPVAIIAADLSGDRRIDIATANQATNTVSVLLGNSTGTLQTKVDYFPGLSPFALVTGDVNSDGYIDLITANSADSSIGVLIANTDGSFKPKSDFAAGAALTGLIIGDWNGDSKLDLAVANGATLQMTLLPGSGTGQFNSQVTVNADVNLTGISATDVNSDGATDIITFESTNNTTRVWLGH
jgi:hypothetical protein